MPLVSVLMSVYNGEKYLKESIKSILAQTFSDFEFIIINDGSIDRTKEIILSFDDKRIKYFENRKRIGLTKSLNKGLHLAQGKYIARMDADDISLPKRLKSQYEFVKLNPEFGLLGTYAEAIDEKGNFLYDIIMPYEDEVIKYSLYYYTPFVHASIFLRKELVFQTGLYNEEYEYAQDYDLFFHLSSKTKFYNLPDKLLRYRMHPLSRSVNAEDKYSQDKCAYSILAKHISPIIQTTPDQAKQFFWINRRREVSWLSFIKYIVVYRKLLKYFLKTNPNIQQNKILREKVKYIYLSYIKNYLKYKVKMNLKNIGIRKIRIRK